MTLWLQWLSSIPVLQFRVSWPTAIINCSNTLSIIYKGNITRWDQWLLLVSDDLQTRNLITGMILIESLMGKYSKYNSLRQTTDSQWFAQSAAKITKAFTSESNILYQEVVPVTVCVLMLETQDETSHRCGREISTTTVSLQYNKIPNIWKISNIIPIQKHSKASSTPLPLFLSPCPRAPAEGGQQPSTGTRGGRRLVREATAARITEDDYIT